MSIQEQAKPGDTILYHPVDEVSYPAIYLGEHDGNPWIIYTFTREESDESFDNGEPPTMPFAARWQDVTSFGVPCPTCSKPGDFKTMVGTAVEKVIWEGYQPPYDALKNS